MFLEQTTRDQISWILFPRGEKTAPFMHNTKMLIMTMSFWCRLLWRQKTCFQHGPVCCHFHDRWDHHSLAALERSGIIMQDKHWCLISLQIIVSNSVSAVLDWWFACQSSLGFLLALVANSLLKVLQSSMWLNNWLREFYGLKFW